MNKSELTEMLEAMWQDYLAMNPEARQIHQLFSDLNYQVINDHIALRTFDLEEVNIEQMARPFIQAGYEPAGEYHFKAKQLYAQHFQHRDPLLPKVFISQLMTESLSSDSQLLIHNMIAELEPEQLVADNLCYSGRAWDLSYTEYQQLLEQSEYAAWLAAFGFRPNHFTIFVNALTSHNSIGEVNQFLKDKGFRLNTAGGEIKGSVEARLEQSSTLANPVSVHFSDCEAEIPGCYYEFARRYPLDDGTLYQGFVTASADKIFESTDTR
ncbi:DUF1338 domain-containing protein [Neptuniibacter halophilus]|uniref:DUF1338 domain-containing protein n=1 Tax=Neptuniibacter halophilus TaxID=651666 RepID=UPI0025737362|nr:DUF1338 domain-containing protein [Neptuniibacter halophilus]